MNRKHISDKELAAMTVFEAASYWFVRQDAGDMSAPQRMEFERWLAGSDEHRKAYEQTAAMWAGFEDAADGSALRALRVAALASGPAPNVWPRAAAIAATLVVITVGIAAAAWQLSGGVRLAETAAAPTAGSRYATGHNQRTTVTLPDGSTVSMNLDTAMTTQFTPTRRLIRLEQGQAFFEVARDAARPFVVAAGDRHIQALGTKFDIRLDPGRLQVVLLEGRVSVEESEPSLLDRLTRGSARVELQPNQKWIADESQIASITPTNALQATSWREGWIVFEDETVADAIAELNRYCDRPIVAGDEAVRRMRLSGVFRIGQPERFGTVIQELLPLQVQRGTQGETILVRRDD